MSPTEDIDAGGGDPSLEAAEYALGVSDAAARAAFARRLEAEPALAAEVAGWEARLAPLADAIPPVPPRPGVWLAVTAALPRPLTGAATLSELRRQVSLWRATSAVGLAAAAVLAVVVVLPARRPPPQPAPPPMMTASLMDPREHHEHAPMFVAALDPVRHELIIAPAGVRRRRDMAAEVWVMPQGGKPEPLGLASFEAPMHLSLAPSVGATGWTKIAVSLEPPGGSPTGQPTGPVLAVGDLTGA